SMEIGYTLMAEVLAVGLSALDGTAFADGAQFNLLAAETLSVTAQCVQGGTIEVEGTFTDDVGDDGAGTFTMSLRQTPKNCGVQTSEGLFRVDGAPNLSVTASMVVVSGWDVADFKATYKGGFAWTGPAGSGNCSMDVTFDVNYKNPQASKVTGKMCGHSVSG